MPCLSQALQDDANKKKPVVEEVSKTGDWIIKNTRKDPRVKPAVVEKTEFIEGIYSDFISKVETRYNKLQRALLKTQEFEVTLNEFFDALGDLEKRLDDERPLDARFEELKEIKQDYEVSTHS